MNEVDVLEIDPKYGVIITTDANLSMEQIEKIRAELGRINLKSCIIAGGRWDMCCGCPESVALGRSRGMP